MESSMGSKSGEHTIIKNTFLYVLLKNSFMLLSIVAGIAVVRMLGPVENGKWALVWQFISYGAPVVSLGFMSTLAKYMPEYSDESEKNRLFSKVLSIVLVVICCVLMICAGGYGLLARWVPAEVRDVWFFFFIFIGLVALFNIFEGLYRGLGQFNQWTWIDGLRSFLAGGAGCLLVIVYEKSYKVMFFAYLLVTVFFLAYILFQNRRRFGWSGLALEKRIRTFTYISFGGQVIFMVASIIHLVLIRSLLHDPAQVGLFDAGARIPRLVETLFLAPLSVPFLYYFSHHEMGMDKERIIRLGTRALGLAFGLFSLILFSFSDFVIPVLFSNTYRGSIPVLKWYAFVPFWIALQQLAGVFFMAIEKPLIPNGMSLLCLIVFFVFDYLLIGSYQAMGAVISTLIGVSLCSFLYLVFYSRENIHLFRVWFLFVFVMGLSVASETFILKFSSVPVFLAGVFLTRLISMDDIRKVFEMVRAIRAVKA
jgi:PST family polysaccharide transporter